MPRDPQSRLTDDGTLQQERPTGFDPEEVMEPGTQQTAADADWLTMTAADPAFFLKDPGSE